MKKYLLLLFIMIASTMAFCGCSNDDAENSIQSSQVIKESLIGVWSTSINNPSWKYINILPNGEIKLGSRYSTTEGWEIRYDNKAYWSYDVTNQSISMYNNSSAFTFKVVMADDRKSWAGVDSNGKTTSFIKYEE